MVCSDAPSAEGVTVTGRLSDEELASWYRRAWVFCLPSTYEGFGIPYAEALLSGTPVVASPNPGARYVLADGKYGRIVEDPELGSSILELLSSQWPGAGTIRARAGASRFDLLHVISEYETLYTRTLDR